MTPKNATVPPTVARTARERRGPAAMILRVATALVAAMALSVATASGAWAAYVVTFLQVGPDVVATGGGSLDLAGLLKQRDPTPA